jgi:hypothetical protein
MTALPQCSTRQTSTLQHLKPRFDGLCCAGILCALCSALVVLQVATAVSTLVLLSCLCWGVACRRGCSWSRPRL